MNVDGLSVALVTPWTSSGTVDLPAFQKLINRHNRADTSTIVVAGSTGEGNLLTRDERATLIQTAVQHSKKPVFVGCGMPSTWETIESGKQAMDLGATGLLVVAPFYARPTQEGLVAHFHAVCDALKAPVIVYNNPGRCAVGIDIDTFIRIAEHEFVVGFKDSDSDLSRLVAIRTRLDRHVVMLAGDDSFAIQYMQMGGDGWVSVVGNIEPQWCADVCISQGKTIHPKLLELVNQLGRGGNPIMVKEALSYRSVIQPFVRLPLVMREGQNDDLKRYMDEISSS